MYFNFFRDIVLLVVGQKWHKRCNAKENVHTVKISCHRTKIQPSLSFWPDLSCYQSTKKNTESNLGNGWNKVQRNKMDFKIRIVEFLLALRKEDEQGKFVLNQFFSHWPLEHVWRIKIFHHIAPQWSRQTIWNYYGNRRQSKHIPTLSGGSSITLIYRLSGLFHPENFPNNSLSIQQWKSVH